MPCGCGGPGLSGTYLDHVLGFTLEPWLDPGVDDRPALSLGVHKMCRAPDQHSPSLTRLQIDLVDLEGDVVFGVRDSGPEVLVSEGVLALPAGLAAAESLLE